MKQKVLFLCTGNSCRSQMAEGYLRYFASDRFEVTSAGLEPSRVDPNAILVMMEDGIDISLHTSNDVNDFITHQFDYIITVCDNAKERCPYFPGEAKRIHWSLEDPAAATGTEEEIINIFKEVRNQIKERITQFVENKEGD